MAPDANLASCAPKSAVEVCRRGPEHLALGESGPVDRAVASASRGHALPSAGRAEKHSNSPNRKLPQNGDSLIESIEVQMLLESLFQHSGYEFRNFARTTMSRRLRDCLPDFGALTISQLQGIVLRDTSSLLRLVQRLTVNVTAMFRDPDFYCAIRNHVVPEIAARSFARIWAAGCATGEEAYSLAIMLEEAGISGQARIYATDVNPAVLDRARTGCYPLEAMQEYSRNYQRAGGRRSFSDYYSVTSAGAVLSPRLRQNVVWAQHDLSTDSSFNEFDVIFCRNVLIYFNRPLQDRAHRLLYESLKTGGILALGRNESLLSTPCEERYETMDQRVKVFRRIR